MRIKTIGFLLAMGIAFYAGAQSPAADLSNRIARRMKDTLQLSDSQKNAIYAINMQLHAQKMSARQQYSAGDSLQYHIQRIENTRDALYGTVLSPEKYLLYLEKKKNLVSSN